MREKGNKEKVEGVEGGKLVDAVRPVRPAGATLAVGTIPPVMRGGGGVWPPDSLSPCLPGTATRRKAARACAGGGNFWPRERSALFFSRLGLTGFQTTPRGNFERSNRRDYKRNGSLHPPASHPVSKGPGVEGPKIVKSLRG